LENARLCCGNGVSLQNVRWQDWGRAEVPFTTKKAEMRIFYVMTDEFNCTKYVLE